MSTGAQTGPASSLADTLRTALSRLLTASLTVAPATLAVACGGSHPADAIRLLAPATAVAPESFGQITGLHALSDGRVLVNDTGHRQVLLLDHDLRAIQVVLDSGHQAGRVYIGQRPGALFRFWGDTSVFLVRSTGAFIVIEPNGTLGRVLFAPGSVSLAAVSSQPEQSAGFDEDGRLIFWQRAAASQRPPVPTLTPVTVSPARAPGSARNVGRGTTEQLDSALLLRLDLGSGDVDTIGRYSQRRARLSFVRLPERDDLRGYQHTIVVPIVNPLPLLDDWALLSNGSVVIVRSDPFRMDVFDRNGRARSTSLPWPRVPLTGVAKAAIMDSVRSHADSAFYTVSMLGRFPRGAVPPSLRVKGPPHQYVDASELPDIRPAFLAPGAVADADAHVWVRRLLPGSDTAVVYVYDVIDTRGRVVDRVQLPPGAHVVGFGVGAVYLSTPRGDGYSLSRVPLPWTR